MVYVCICINKIIRQSNFLLSVICKPLLYVISESPLYLVMTEVWVHNEHVTGSPQTTLFISSVAEVMIIRGLHRDQSKESPVIRTTGAEGQFFCRIGSQDLTSVTAQTYTVMHDLVGYN